MATKQSKARLVILRIDSYEGSDTFLRCGNERQDYLYAVVSIDPDGSAEIVDSSYRSMSEASAAWPEAAVAGRPKQG